jgi:hypothetical protein
MAIPFDKFGIRKSVELLNKATPPLVQTNALFITGDHFQNGAGWIGPMPALTEPGYPEAILLIRRGFVSKNVIAEVSERHASGVVGRELAWGFEFPGKDADELSDAEKDELSEVEGWMTSWMDDRGLAEMFQQAVITLLWGGRAALRLYIPVGFAKQNENGEFIVSAPDLPRALEQIWVEHSPLQRSMVYEDPDTKRQLTIYLYKRDNRDHVELSYLDENRDKTIIRTISRAGDTQYDLSMGRRLVMYEMKRPLLITEQVQQAQRAINLAISTIPRTVVTAGFLERVFLNAQMPGSWVDKDTGEVVDPSKSDNAIFKPARYPTGPNTTNFVQGLQYDDEQGRSILSTPNVQWREPIPATSSIEAKNSHYNDILDEVDQAHVLMAADATASGKSRIDARIDYVASLMLTKPQVEAAGRWLFSTLLSLAEAVMGEPGKYSNRMRPVVRARLDAGSLTSEEQKQLVERVEKGLLPKEWAMEMLGVDDVDAAARLINEDPGSKLDASAKQAATFNAWVMAGMDHNTAALLTGLSDDQVKLIVASPGNAEDTAEEQ